MKLEVKRLVNSPVGEKETLDSNVSSLSLDDDLKAEDATGTLKLTKLEQELLGEFSGSANVRVACDRCAGDYTQVIPLAFSQEYLLAGEGDPEKLTISKKFEIDISEPLRQEIIAALPVKKLCKVTCAGICAGCGVNLNEGKCKCGKK